MGHAHYPTARNVAASARGRGIPLVAACPTSDALMLGSWPQKRSSSTWCNGRGRKVQEAKERDKAKLQNQREEEAEQKAAEEPG